MVSSRSRQADLCLMSLCFGWLNALESPGVTSLPSVGTGVEGADTGGLEPEGLGSGLIFQSPPGPICSCVRADQIPWLF